MLVFIGKQAGDRWETGRTTCTTSTTRSSRRSSSARSGCSCARGGASGARPPRMRRPELAPAGRRARSDPGRRRAASGLVLRPRRRRAVAAWGRSGAVATARARNSRWRCTRARALALAHVDCAPRRARLALAPPVSWATARAADRGAPRRADWARRRAAGWRVVWRWPTGIAVPRRGRDGRQAPARLRERSGRWAPAGALARAPGRAAGRSVPGRAARQRASRSSSRRPRRCARRVAHGATRGGAGARLRGRASRLSFGVAGPVLAGATALKAWRGRAPRMKLRSRPASRRLSATARGAEGSRPRASRRCGRTPPNAPALAAAMRYRRARVSTDAYARPAWTSTPPTVRSRRWSAS